MNNAMHSGNLIVQGQEYVYEALILPKDSEEGIGCGPIVKLDVFNREDLKILSFNSGQWLVRDWNDPVQDEILKLIMAEYRRYRY